MTIIAVRTSGRRIVEVDVCWRCRRRNDVGDSTSDNEGCGCKVVQGDGRVRPYDARGSAAGSCGAVPRQKRRPPVCIPFCRFDHACTCYLSRSSPSSSERFFTAAVITSSSIYNLLRWRHRRLPSEATPSSGKSCLQQGQQRHRPVSPPHLVRSFFIRQCHLPAPRRQRSGAATVFRDL